MTLEFDPITKAYHAVADIDVANITELINKTEGSWGPFTNKEIIKKYPNLCQFPTKNMRMKTVIGHRFLR